MNRNREFSFKQIHAGLNKEGSSSIEALQKLISGKINQLNSQFDSLSVKKDEQNSILIENNRQTFESELEKVNYINEKEQFLYDNNTSQYDSYEEYLESDINESESNFESEEFSRQKKITTTNPYTTLQVQNNKRISLLTKGEKVDSMILENGREEGDYEIYSEPQSPSPRHRNTIQFHRKTKKAKTISITNYDESLPQKSGSYLGNLKLALKKRSQTFIRESPSIHNSNSNDSGDDNTEEDSQSDFFQDNNLPIQEEFDQSGALSREEISINQEEAKEELQEHFKFSLEGTFLGQSIGKPIKKYSFPLEFRNKNIGMDEKIREKFLLIQNYQHLLQLETTSFSSNQYDQNMLSKQIIPNHPEFLAVKNNCKPNNKNQTQDLELIQDSKFPSADYYKGRLSKCYSSNIYGQVSSESLNNILQALSESLQQRDREKTSFIESRKHEKILHNSLVVDKRGDKRLILDQTEELAVPVFSLSLDLANNDCIPRKEKIITVPILDVSPKKILKRNRNDSSSPNPRHHHQSVQKSVTYFQNPEIDLVTNNLRKNSRQEPLYSKSLSFKADNANPLL